MSPYYSEEPQEKYRDPLKPFLVALIILLLLFAVIIVLLYMRLQSANARAESLAQEVALAQTQLDDLRAAQAQPTDAPTPGPSATPVPTPEPTPEPTATPTPSPTPEPTPVPLLRDTVTEEMLGYVYRPADEFWLDEAQSAVVVPYMLAVHYGPGMDWGENMALNMGDAVEILARRYGWVLLRTADGRYGWAAGELLRDASAPAATPAPAYNGGAPAVTVTATPAPTAAPTPTPDYTEVSNPDLK